MALRRLLGLRAGDWVNRFLVWRCNELPAKAWFLPLTDDEDEPMLDDWTGDSRDLLPLFDRAEPLAADRSRPEDWTITVRADEPGWVIVSQLDDPQWSARWIGLEDRASSTAEIRPAFRKPGETAGGWQYLKVPFNGADRWTLRLTYEPRDVREGTCDLDHGMDGLGWPALAVGLRRRPRPAREYRRRDATGGQT